jgi:cobalt-zinc-cadmium efflux system outer membrane protein
MTRRPIAPAATGRRPGHSPGRLLPLGLILLLVAGSAAAENAPNILPGATLETVLALAKQLSPELKARALDGEAARAGVEIAGSLADPALKVTSDEIDRVSGPRQNKMIYSVEQDIPLWGKRELKRSSARAMVDQRSAQAQSSEAELVEKVKVVFAQYYRAARAIRTTEDLHRAVHDIAQAAQNRYAQGRETQQEVYRAQIEITRLETELTRLAAARATAQRQLNILIGRPVDAPLAEPQRLRELPPPGAINPDALVDRARMTNPQLAAGAAEIAGAQSDKALAAKGWYPDVTVGAGAIDRTGNGPNGYMAWVGLRVPLQWGLHDAQEREASARARAAEARRQAVALQLAGDLAETASALAGNRNVERLTRMQLLPQSEALLKSATASYAAGRTSLQDVLRTEHDLADIRVQLLDIELDQQRQLAAIERMIGSDL